ncbi:MAG: hypothetical protein LUG64_01280 [Clostridiales bacterium]|nr:hypothetical protein [Clostridiales bacterium]
MDNSETVQFSVRDTNVVKGVAIILLLFHHCFLSASRFEGYDISFFPLHRGWLSLLRGPVNAASVFSHSSAPMD